MQKTAKRALSGAETKAFLRTSRLDSARAAAFAFKDAAVGRSYAMHAHTRHQLLYAVQGTVRLVVADATFVLPPQRVGFVPAGTKHITHMNNAQTLSLFLDERLVNVHSREVRVIDVTPLMREMILFSARWPASRRSSDPLANAFFRSFGLLLGEWLKSESSYRFPRGRSKPVQRAIELTLQRFGDLELPWLCEQLGIAERSLRRHLLAETGLSFRELSGQARVLRAMELLAGGEHNVTEAALAVGFNSLSAFAKSFTRVTGESPRSFRERVRLAKIPV